MAEVAAAMRWVAAADSAVALLVEDSEAVQSAAATTGDRAVVITAAMVAAIPEDITAVMAAIMADTTEAMVIMAVMAMADGVGE